MSVAPAWWRSVPGWEKANTNRDLNTNELQEKHLKAGLPQLETITIQGEKHPFLFWFSCIAFLIIITLGGFLMDL